MYTYIPSLLSLLPTHPHPTPLGHHRALICNSQQESWGSWPLGDVCGHFSGEKIQSFLYLFKCDCDLRMFVETQANWIRPKKGCISSAFSKPVLPGGSSGALVKLHVILFSRKLKLNHLKNFEGLPWWSSG